MLFNSYGFIFVFLPIFLIGWRLLQRYGETGPLIGWLGFMSLVFYAAPNAQFLWVLLVSIALNFIAGRQLRIGPDAHSEPARRAILVAIVAFNLAFLGYFKYRNFFLDNLGAALGRHWQLVPLLLPPAISFHTFQQISYDVECYRRGDYEPRFRRYLGFVAFFPQLIAGPIVRYRELVPQFDIRTLGANRRADLAAGLTQFVIGLAKKTVLADQLARVADPVFSPAALAGGLSAADAWLGALAYTLQLYFDFSAYSDMAIGLARMLGIRLPDNFNSPYKAASVIEFWRRWHMTLSRWLRDYVYIPLGGNRAGEPRRYANIMITMLLGGLWHGAGWNFIFWGGLHGLYLALDHLFATLAPARLKGWLVAPAGRLAAQALTFLAVVWAWVPFRAGSLGDAAAVWLAMLGGGHRAPGGVPDGVSHGIAAALVLAALGIVWLLPNAQELLGGARYRFLPAWRFSVPAGVALGVMAMLAIVFMTDASAFIYFRF